MHVIHVGWCTYAGRAIQEELSRKSYAGRAMQEELVFHCSVSIHHCSGLALLLRSRVSVSQYITPFDSTAIQGASSLLHHHHAHHPLLSYLLEEGVTREVKEAACGVTPPFQSKQKHH